MDKIVSAVYYEGEVYIFTEQGGVFRMYKDSSGNPLFQRVARLELR